MEIDRARVERVQTEIRTASLDALICQLAPHVLMLTGYAPVLGQSFVVFPARGEPAVIVPEAELPFAREGWCPDVRPYHSTVLDSDQSVLDQVTPLLGAVVDERGLSSARFGVEGSSPMVPASYSQIGFPSAGLLHALRDLFPRASLVDVGPLLAWLQAQKTEPELARLRRAYDVSALAFEAARGAVQDGTTEAAVAAAALGAAEARGRQGGATRVLPFVHVMSGPRAGLAYEAFNLTGDRTLCFGDPVIVQLEVYVDGFWCEMTRTFFVGNPGAEGARIYETCLEAQDLAIKAARPGAAAAEVDRVARDYLQGTGFGAAFKHGTGHGVGFQAISHLQPPRLAPGSTDTILEGMTFNVEPGIYLHGWGGCRINDTVVASAGGAQLLSRVPRELAYAVVPQRGKAT